jgi:RNA polymerase sigma-70 factor (ECF subfamily)
MTETEFLRALRAQDRKAQRRLYERYAPGMFAVCRRYLRSREDAEEALGSGFFKVFSQIHTYSGSGSLEGWIRRIMVNEALMLLRRAQPLVFPGDQLPLADALDSYSIEAELSAREIIELLDQLPPGCRAVFNLYVMEGFRHQEIADALGVSINTSKSQLILAKEKLRQLLLQKGITRII